MSSWIRKFAVAFRGLRLGIRGQSSYLVYFPAMAGVVAAAFALRMDRIEWCILVLCIAGVLAAEMFNTALEAMARSVTREQDPHVCDALDVASAAVLLTAIGAAMVGAILFGYRLVLILGG
jgi:diacylglycerol kinase